MLDRFKSRAEPEPSPDRDEDRPFAPGQWKIDPYEGMEPTYEAVKKVVEARDKALDSEARRLREQFRLSEAQVERFRRAAVDGSAVDGPSDGPVRDAVKAWRTGNDWADVVLAELDHSHADLRGMGGAGVPATDKWRDVRAAVREARKRDDDDDRAFVIVNADESEPGTFKDRELLLRCPHVIVEGLILAALVTDATQGFVYIRHEYAEQIGAVEREILRAETLGVCGPNARVLGRPLLLSVFVSPGGYICGEQTALLEAMSDRRGEPRNIPPKPETNGLDDRPTLVSNVETYAWVPYIWLKGGATYAATGVNGWEGSRFFSVCGDVVRPGVYEVPMGLTLRKLIYGEDYCQGVAGGAKLKAIAPSGPSGGFLPARLIAGAGLNLRKDNEDAWRGLAERRGFDPNVRELDVLDLELELALFRKLSPTGALGAGIVVYAEYRDMAEQAVNALEFFRNESCGKCVPCRIGSQKLAALGSKLLDGAISAQRWDELLNMVKELGEAMSQASICGLGRAAPVALTSAAKHFGSDVAAHLGRTLAEERR
jgi:NADH:ubiquinone oxidoreductase subunit F (NADH-binding)